MIFMCIHLHCTFELYFFDLILLSLYLFLFFQVITNTYLGDFLSLELVSGGSLLLKYETGGGLSPEKTAAIGQDTNDGEVHHVAIGITNNGATVVLDNGLNCTTGASCYAEIQATPPSLPLFSGPLYLAGVDLQNNTQFHLESTSSLISSFYSIRVNHYLIEYKSITMSSFIDLGYTRAGPLCTADICTNNQQCVDLWVNTACQCSLGYSGDACERLSTVHLIESSGIQFHGITDSIIGFEFTVQTDFGFLLSINQVRKREKERERD